MVKKQNGSHERAIRVLRLNPGVVAGPPLSVFHGFRSGQLSARGADHMNQLLVDVLDGV